VLQALAAQPSRQLKARPHEPFETGDPVTAGFTYMRWLGDRKRIEEITTIWKKLVIDGTAEMEEWTQVRRLTDRNC
jgi:hypothetical protein